jgi:hypothetical protein
LSLTRQEKLDAQAIFAADNACTDCGGIHKRACPRVKRKVFLGNGNLTEVEYFKRFDATGVIWPEDAFDPDGDSDADGVS